MKTALSNLLCLSFLPLSVLAAEEDSTPDSPAAPQVEETTGIPGPIANGSPSAPVPPPEPIPFTVLSERIQETQVTQSPEMAGLPAVTGTIQTTVQLVADPGLPEPPSPLPPDDRARVEEAQARYRDTRILLVSATVIDQQKTLLKLYPSGRPEAAVTAVSNLHFGDFSGFGSFVVATLPTQAGGEAVRKYALVMSLGDTTAEALGNPELPVVPEGSNLAYVVKEGNDPESLQALADLHELYRVEGNRMRTARLAREKAQADRKAYLLANPPQPKDVTIRFWRSDTEP